MIYCSQCGTQNRDGSKFCSNCAARLAPAAGLICPMCSTANPVETVFCNNCGARLVPLTGGPDANRRDQSPPIRGLSLPTKPAPPAEETEPEEPVTKEKIEDWLAKLRASPPAEEDQVPAVPPEIAPAPPLAPAAPMPTWVKPAPEDASPESSSESFDTTAEAESVPPETREQLPGWLMELGAQTKLPEAAVAPEPNDTAPVYAPSTDDGELPDWLGLETQDDAEHVDATLPELTPLERAETPPALFQEPEPTLIEPAKPEEIPAWVEQLKPREQAPLAPTEPKVTDEVDVVEMSEWLRTPTTTFESAPIAPEKIGDAVEFEGPLANLRGVLPLAIAMSEPHLFTPYAPAEQKDGAHLFDEILAAPPAETARPPRRRMRRGVPGTRGTIYLLLALAVIVPFFVPLNISGSSIKISDTPAAKFFDTLQGLANDSTVLVAFDYEPSVSGEMDLIANAVVRHLVQRRIKVIALSTLETGPTLAQRVLASSVSESNDYRYGAQYLHLGFLPGHEAGLAQLAEQGFPPTGRDFGRNQLIGQYPIAANVKTVGSLALVIVFAGTEEPLKNWVEQYRPRVNAKIAVGASAAVEPRARTYRDANQLVALVSGPIGAAQYEILTNQQGAAVTRIASQSVAQLLLIGVVLAGNIIYWVMRARKKE